VVKALVRPVFKCFGIEVDLHKCSWMVSEILDSPRGSRLHSW
jgi:hypothetical protein